MDGITLGELAHNNFKRREEGYSLQNFCDDVTGTTILSEADPENVRYAITRSCEMGLEDISECIVENSPKFWPENYSFVSVCNNLEGSNANIPRLIYFYQTLTGMSREKIKDQMLFDAVLYGRLDLAKKIMEIEEWTSRSEARRMSLHLACALGYLCLAQYLYWGDNDFGSVYGTAQKLFVNCCLNRQMCVAKWIWVLCPEVSVPKVGKTPANIQKYLVVLHSLPEYPKWLKPPKDAHYEGHDRSPETRISLIGHDVLYPTAKRPSSRLPAAPLWGTFTSFTTTSIITHYQ